MRNKQSSWRADDILSQVDIILPSQYFGSGGSSALSGERRLMLAVLIDAINVLQSWKGTGSPRRRRDFAEAVQWVNTCGTHHPFSFDSVCDALELDPQVLRSRLHGLTARPANSARRLALGHLRIKELSRRPHMTANRQRQRERISRLMTKSNEPTMPFGRSEVQTDTHQHQDWSGETSDSLAAFGSLSSGTAIEAIVSW